MHIEISAGGLRGGVAVASFQSGMKSYISGTDSMISSFKAVASKTYNLNGGVGRLSEAVVQVNSRVSTEESRKNGAETVQRKANDFLDLAIRIDKSVAAMVKQNQEELYGKYPRIKPSLDQWTSSLMSNVKKWLEKAIHAQPVKENVKDGKELLKASANDKDSFIEEFEKSHPEQAKQLNEFLNGGKNNQLTEDDIRNIKYLTYNANEPFRSIFLNSLSKYRIGNADMNGNAYYKPALPFFFIIQSIVSPYHTVNYTYDNGDDDCFGNDPRGPYTTVFHECGHAIDDLSDVSKWWGSDTENFTVYNNAMGRDVTIKDAIEYDVFYNENNPHSVTSIANEVINSGKSGSDGNINNVISAFQSGNTSGLSNDDLNLYNAVRNQHLRTTESRAQYEAVSDVYGAMTHNKLRNGYGHDETYWSDNTNAAKELWAEYFSYNMAGDVENLKYLIQYFPEASKVLRKYANALSS